MPKIRFGDRTITCAEGTTLREALQVEGITPHNGRSRWLNCTGIGSCGTCAVEIHGEVGPLTAMERWRLAFPPHDRSRGLRLACQVTVTSDLAVTKHPGFWGQSAGETEHE